MPYPVQGPVTQYFGEDESGLGLGLTGGNKGWDFGVPIGTPVSAVASGVVIAAGPSSDGWGISVKIQDAEGYIHNYGHLSGVNVNVGDQIAPGTIVGASGNSGISTGEHLSYDVLMPDGNTAVDPTRWLEGEGMAASTGGGAISGDPNTRVVPVGGGYQAIQELEDGVWVTVKYIPIGDASSRVGTAAPNPLDAAGHLINKFKAEIESGRFQADQAWKQFEKELSEANFGLSRDIARTDAGLRTQAEVGERAKTTLGALRGMSTVSQLNVPFLNEIFGGQVQGTPVNFPQLFDQGTGGLASIPQVMPQAPTFSQVPTFTPPTMPNLGGLLGAGAAGFPGFNVGGTAAPTFAPTAPPPTAAPWPLAAPPPGPAPYAGAWG